MSLMETNRLELHFIRRDHLLFHQTRISSEMVFVMKSGDRVVPKNSFLSLHFSNISRGNFNNVFNHTFLLYSCQWRVLMTGNLRDSPQYLSKLHDSDRW
jgi:hypothetical protein